MWQELINNPVQAIVFLVGIIFAITIHEYAHARAATLFGDDTPRLMGRLNLNPASHLDPLGALLFVLVGFGWGRPVVYNPLRLKRHSDELWIALAGPLTNLVAALLLRLAIMGVALLFPGLPSSGVLFLQYVAVVAHVNVLLAAFNMLPIPPLDGSSIIAYFFPSYRGLAASQLGLLLLLLLIMPLGSTNLLGTIINPILNAFQFITLGL